MKVYDERCPMKEVNFIHKAEHLFVSLDSFTFKLTARESNAVEFKESFNWASKDKYARSIVSFANNRGGHLIFGVTNQPRRLVGLPGSNFETLDEAIITSYFNGLFYPEIHYEKFVLDVESKKVGVIYTHQSIEIGRAHV